MAYKHIMILGDGIPKEAKASGAITPGHLLERTSASVDTVRVHTTAGGNVVPKIFAVEDDIQGKEISQAYATTNNVLMRVCQGGEEVYAIIKNGQIVAKASLLESAGDGTLQVHTPDSGSVTELNEQIVGRALEACDMSSSSGADPAGGRCRIEIV